ncbi:MAG TPA: hypothetical protein VFQ65_18855, partial [Kofleriaceae bacterium]|nr:hypothetical protein [Kofleriaceae bacterium]
MANKPRFERAKDVAGVGIDSREGPPGEYLAKLWTLFGPPEGESDGSAYYSVRDRETGRKFLVSTNAAGVSYGGAPISSHPRDFEKTEKAYGPVFAAFDALLAVTPLADCTVEMQVGDGKIILGAKDGVPFERNVQPQPTRAQAIARGEAALAGEGDAGFFYDETVTLLDIVPDAGVLLGKLWHRALAEAVATLKGELSRPNPGGMIYPIIESILPRLEKAAEKIGID